MIINVFTELEKQESDYGFLTLKYIFYTIETEKRESDEVHPKLIMGGNGKREEGEDVQGKGGEGDRGGEHDESVEESVGEEPQSKKEGVRHQLEGQRVGKKEQVITTEEGENPINTIIKKTIS